MILSGEFVTAEKAHSMGLVNGVFDPEELHAGVMAVAEVIAQRGPKALGFAIEAVIRGGECNLEEGLAIEADLFGMTSATEDMKEGMTAFLEKRPANFQGR